MEITVYQTNIHVLRTGTDSFIGRNPNLTYLVCADDGSAECALIDISSDVDELLNNLEQKQCKLTMVLLTHHHVDHMITLHELARRVPNLRIGIHPASFHALSVQGFKHLFPIKNDMDISIGSESLHSVYTPGHTLDSICFWWKDGNAFFSGDTLLGGGIGCCDYRNGGDRRRFHQTIQHLCRLLPPETDIYPGHCSEHYKSLPPYRFSEEQANNPYLVDTLKKDSGSFDRKLKNFSRDFENREAFLLREDDLDEIYAMEQDIWPSELQASRATIQSRLRQGHHILTIKNEDVLLGMVCWCYSEFTTHAPAMQFPATFADFSNCRPGAHENLRSAFIYSVGVKPAYREKGYGSLLLQTSIAKILADNVHEVFVDSRLPSYNGSQQSGQERVSPEPEFKQVIDRYLVSGKFPTSHELALDPRIRFYIRNGFWPWRIVRDFIYDHPSGDMRVICHQNLVQEDESAPGRTNQKTSDTV